MRQQILTKIVKLFTPKPDVQLGRWRLKHDQIMCDKYLTNNYADPGYPNCDKLIWIEKFKDEDNLDSLNIQK